MLGTSAKKNAPGGSENAGEEGGPEPTPKETKIRLLPAKFGELTVILGTPPGAEGSTKKMETFLRNPQGEALVECHPGGRPRGSEIHTIAQGNRPPMVHWG